ncbi:MAG: hypothetical protein K2I72_03065, partial [Bacilli bacterium]|nr:hypothetical protein [Bacilli bacterium]
EAYLIWKEENPEKENVPQSAMIELPNGKSVPLGRRISTMKLIYKSMQEGKHYQSNSDLAEDEIAWWTKHGLDLGKKIICSEDEYREAYLIWKEENPEQENVPHKTVIELPNGKSVPLGQRISLMRLIYKAMQEGKHYGSYRDLTEEEISWWTEHGVDFETLLRKTFSEEKYRDAYLIWKTENPEQENVPYKTVIELPNGKKVSLGAKINRIKLIYQAMQEGKHYGSYRDLTEEEISWWTENGINFETILRKAFSEDEYREAYLIWKKENPKKRNVSRSTVVILSNGNEVPLGQRISTMQMIYKAMQEGKHYVGCKDLTKAQISWWTEQGVELRGNLVQSEEEYREVYLIWKAENPEQENVPYKTVIELPNGRKVSLGLKIFEMKSTYRAMQKGKRYGKHRDLTEEQISWWTEHGVNFETLLRETFSEEEYRDAYLIWKKQNSRKENVSNKTVIELPNGRKVPLGQRISLMRLIYKAMQEGKHY